MRNNIWLKTIIQACHEIVYYIPIFLLANHYLVQVELPVLIGVMLIGYMLGFALGKIAMIRILEWLACMIVAATISVAVVGISIGGAAMTLLTTIAVFRGFRFRYAPWKILFSSNFYIISIVIYFVTPIVFMFAPDLKVYSPQLYWAGLYCVIHALYTFNFRQLEDAAQNKQAGQSIARNVLGANRMGISFVVIVIFIVININQLMRMVTTWFRELIAWIYDFLSRPKPEEQPQPELLPPNNVDGIGMPEPKPKSSLAELLDMIVYYVAYVIVFVVVIALVYLVIVKLLIPLYNRFMTTAKLTRELEVGYSDEEEKLDVPQFGQWVRGLMKRNIAMPEPEDNSGRVRYLYRESIQSAIKKGYEFQSSQTPLEIQNSWPDLKAKHRLPSRLIALYNKARYGEAPITDEEMQRLKEID